MSFEGWAQIENRGGEPRPNHEVIIGVCRLLRPPREEGTSASPPAARGSSPTAARGGKRRTGPAENRPPFIDSGAERADEVGAAATTGGEEDEAATGVEEDEEADRMVRLIGFGRLSF